MSDIFRALADETRRQLLDKLFTRNGQTLAELTSDMPMSRQAASKHLAILEAANLVSTIWRGREKLHYLNPAPIAEMVRRWVGKLEDARLDSLIDFKHQIEQSKENRSA